MIAQRILMSKVWFQFLTLVLFASVSTAAFSGEKGGSGIDGEEQIILENFKNEKSCPSVFQRKLCDKIDNKLNSTKWEIKPKTEDDQNEEEFYYTCCMTAI